jgi:hypothetical protein
VAELRGAEQPPSSRQLRGAITSNLQPAFTFGITCGALSALARGLDCLLQARACRSTAIRAVRVSRGLETGLDYRVKNAFCRKQLAT